MNTTTAIQTKRSARRRLAVSSRVTNLAQRLAAAATAASPKVKIRAEKVGDFGFSQYLCGAKTSDRDSVSPGAVNARTFSRAIFMPIQQPSPYGCHSEYFMRSRESASGVLATERQPFLSALAKTPDAMNATTTTIQTKRSARRRLAISSRVTNLAQRLAAAATAASVLAMWAQLTLTGTMTPFVAGAAVASITAATVSVALQPSGEKGGAL